MGWKAGSGMQSEAGRLVGTHELLIVWIDFWGCSNKVPHIGCLTTIGIYCLIVLEARILKSRCQRFMLPLMVLEKDLLQVSLLDSGSSLA